MYRVSRNILIVGLLVCVCVPAAHATLLADHFGVNPQVQLISNWEYSTGNFYTGYEFISSSLAPTHHTGTVDYQVDDWFGYYSQTSLSGHVNYPGTGTYPSGDEPYDNEAYYFDDDANNVYFAVVVGFPSPVNGIYNETRTSPSIYVTQGDFAIDAPHLSGSQTDSTGFAYDYGVDMTDENRPASGNVTSFASNTLGNQVYRTTTGWYLGTPNGAVNPITGNQSNALTNFDPNSTYNPAGTMTDLGGATVSWYQLGLTYGGNSVLENNWQTYVIEITIPKNLLVKLYPGDQLQFHWLMGCRNDGSNAQSFLTGSGDIDFPEPGTTALLLMGLGPLGLWLRSKRGRRT